MRKSADVVVVVDADVSVVVVVVVVVYMLFYCSAPGERSSRLARRHRRRLRTDRRAHRCSLWNRTAVVVAAVVVVVNVCCWREG